MKGQNTCRLAGRCSSSFCSSPVLLSPSWRRHLLSLEVPDIEGQSSSLPANCCSTSSHGSKPPFCAPRPLSSSSPSQHASRFSSPSRGLLTALLASTTGHRSFSSVPNGEERRKKTPSAATVIDHISLSRHYRTFVPSKGLLHISSAASLTRGFRDNQGGLKVQEKKQEDHLPAPRGLRLFFRGLSSVTERKTNPDCVPAGEETWEREEEKAATPGLSPRLKRLMYRAKQRGWVELDLLLGGFAEQNLLSMPPQEVEEFEKILDEENVVLYDCLIGKDGCKAKVPGHLEESEAWRKLQFFIDEKGRAPEPSMKIQ